MTEARAFDGLLSAGAFCAVDGVDDSARSAARAEESKILYRHFSQAMMSSPLTTTNCNAGLTC
jgi:hypothetical protein